MRVVASCGGSKGEIMGNAKRAGTARVAKGSAVGSGSEGGARRATAWMPVWCVVGLVGAQAWMPAVGLVADKYRSSAFSIDELAPLLLSYLASLAVVSALFAVLRMRSQPSKGTYGVLAGAAFSCIGALLLHLLDGMAPDRVAFLFSLSGALLGAGNGLMALVWSSAIARLPGPAQAGSSVAVVLGCCSLAAFAQAVGANALLLGATMALAVSSALCFVLAASRGDVVELPAPQKGIGSAYVRVGAAMGCFGFLFAMMIMQFVIAPHGRASAFTWAYGYAGVLAAVVFLVLVRVVRSSWDFLFALRFVAVPLIVAFYPFDTGTDFSVKFALCFSTLALWCFCTIVPGVLREAADVLHAPVYVMASVGVGGAVRRRGGRLLPRRRDRGGRPHDELLHQDHGDPRHGARASRDEHRGDEGRARPDIQESRGGDGVDDGERFLSGGEGGARFTVLRAYQPGVRRAAHLGEGPRIGESAGRAIHLRGHGYHPSAPHLPEARRPRQVRVDRPRCPRRRGMRGRLIAALLHRGRK